jgi:hypothetical protein
MLLEVDPIRHAPILEAMSRRTGLITAGIGLVVLFVWLARSGPSLGCLFSVRVSRIIPGARVTMIEVTNHTERSIALRCGGDGSFSAFKLTLKARELISIRVPTTNGIGFITEPEVRPLWQKVRETLWLPSSSQSWGLAFDPCQAVGWMAATASSN